MYSEMYGVEKSMNYYLTKRKKGKRKIWYAFFTDPNDSQKCILSTSVELLRKKLGINTTIPLTKEKEAYVIVERAIADGLINIDRDIVDFATYVDEFWDFDNSDYIRRRNQKSPNSIGKDYANNMKSVFNSHAVPSLPPRLKLHEVNSLHIEKVVDDLLDQGKLSKATISKVIQSMSVPLKVATRKKKVPHNPMDGVEPLTSTFKERGIYTLQEISKALGHLYKKGTVGVEEIKDVRGPNGTRVKKSYPVKSDLKPYLAVALAAYTGMRAGEIRALCVEQIELINDDFGIITVDRAFNDYAGQKSTKGKRTRKVPLPRTICDQLLQMGAQNPHENRDLIFWSKETPVNPISSNHILKQFYKALDAIGIKEKNRKQRTLDFHSLRHTFNSTLRGKISDKTLRSIVGHESAAMSDRYTHGTDEELLIVGDAINQLFNDKSVTTEQDEQK